MAFLLKPERIKEIVDCARKLVAPCTSAILKLALATTYSISPRRIGVEVGILEESSWMLRG
jgi:hypothetical protein